MILLSHITGNPNSREAALALVERGWLSELHTTLCWKPGGALDRWLPERWTRVLRRRAFPSEVLDRVRTHAVDEVLRLLARDFPVPMVRGILSRVVSTQRANEAFDAAVAKAVQRGAECSAVYGYIDASMLTFRAAKARGLKCIYELPTIYWRTKQKLLREEAARLPEWAMTLPLECEQADEQARRDEELRLADLIVVPSEWVRRSLEAAPALGGRVVVVPYGGPGETRRLRDNETLGLGDAAFRASPSSPLRVLYVGNLGQAKGLAYLAEAMQMVKPGSMQLTLVGRRVTTAICEPLEAMLSEHNHVDGLPNAEVLRLMPDFDVLVLPTLFEGMSLTVLEAMSQGLAVLTTDHSGYEGVIENGREGLLVPIRDAAALAASLTSLAGDRDRLRGMKAAALRKAKELSAERYRQAVCEAVAPLVKA